MSRSKRKQIAEETLEIIEKKRYRNGQGDWVSIRESMTAAIDGTSLVRPDDFDGMELQCRSLRAAKSTRIEVVNETTFAGSKALLDDGASNVCCLNFASAKNPGGGFLGGSQAQEEALARASGLYACLITQMEYYEYHRRGGPALYSHHMIYSPRVPVFRDDVDRMLDKSWEVSIVTSPAVNAGALNKNHPELADKVLPTMRDRIERVLWLALANGHRNIVLGAWGCGVFRNDPAEIAELFAECLKEDAIRGRFERIRFSVLDNGSKQSTFNAFENKLRPLVEELQCP